MTNDRTGDAADSTLTASAGVLSVDANVFVPGQRWQSKSRTSESSTADSVSTSHEAALPSPVDSVVGYTHTSSRVVLLSMWSWCLCALPAQYRYHSAVLWSVVLSVGHEFRLSCLLFLSPLK